MVHCNAVLKTFEHTYYFAVSAGMRRRLKEKRREVLEEPFKLSKAAAGFDSNFKEGVIYRNTTKRIPRRDQA